MIVRTFPITMDDEYSYPVHTSGHASTLPAEPGDETIARLHQAVFDVTGQRPEQPAKPRIGFLP